MNKKLLISIITLSFFAILLAQNALAGTATISWNANTEPDLAGYKIYYGTSPRSGACPTGGYPNVQSVGNVTTYAFNNLTSGFTYYFSVTAYDTSNNESTCSAEVSKIIPAGDTTAPTISSIAASSITSSGATITWTTNESSDSQVEYGLTTSYGSQTTLNTSIVTSHSQTLSGLSANTLYHYRVKSKDVAGNLATSGDYTFTTGILSCTSRSLVSSSVSPSSVTINGSYTVSCDYGVTTNAINSVVGSGTCVFQSFVGTAARFVCTAGATPGTFNNSCNLSNTSPDYYCVRTDTVASLTVTSPSDTTAPAAPTNLSATAISSTQINLSWTASTDNVGVTGYRVYRCQGSGCAPSVQISTSANNSYSDTGLSPSTTYVYRVAAYDAAGNISGQSSSVSGTTQFSSDTTPPTISNVSTSNVAANSVTVTWQTSEPAISQVDYGLTTAYGSQTTIDNNLVTTHSVTLSNLSSAITYHFRVRSKDQASNESISIDYAFTTQAGTSADTTSPANISDLSVSDITQTSVNLRWSAPGDDGNVGTAASYDLRYSISQITESNWNSATQVNGVVSPVSPGIPQSMVVVGLSPGTTYYFAIKTKDEISNISGLSNIVSAKTQGGTATLTPTSPDTDPPQKPSNCQAITADKQVVLKWQNPSDSDFVRVLIVRKEGSYPTSRTDGAIIYEGNLQELTDANLDNNKTYYYAIYAYDAKPNYSQPVIISAKPQTGKTTIEIPKPTPSPEAPVIIFSKLLYLGLKDTQVQKLQELLSANRTLYPEGKVTGFYGLLTQKAVQRFQCQYNIICSGSSVAGYGLVGPKTRQKLNELYASGNTTLTEIQNQALIAQLQEQIRILQEKIAQFLIQLNQLLQKGTP